MSTYIGVDTSRENGSLSTKVAVVIRFGVFGDAIMATSVIRALKNLGYYVNVYGYEDQKVVYENNPNIDALYLYKGGIGTVVNVNVPDGALLVDLQNSMEGRSVVFNGDEPYGCTKHPDRYFIGCVKCLTAKRDRDERFGHLNYFEETLKHANLDGNPRGELYFTVSEQRKANGMASGWLSKFVVIWNFSSTAFYKQYPFWYDVAAEFCKRHADALIYTSGAGGCSSYEVNDHPQIISVCGLWDMRMSFALMNLSDLVIGGETGPMLAAGCFDVPKIILLSNSTPMNIAKHWVNTTALGHGAPCFPCHQMHFNSLSCLTKEVISWKPRIGMKWPVCQAGIKKEEILEAMEFWYARHQDKKNDDDENMEVIRK